MLAEIPRKPVFPEYIIRQEIARVQSDVQNQVIPVAAGIYSEYKLNNLKLQLISQIHIVDYEDPIFYQLADVVKIPCRETSCPICTHSYGHTHRKPVQCKFCGIWNCSYCICPRKRYHPRAKEAKSERYEICYKCDDKFLSLTLNHGYVERKSLLQQVSSRIKKEKDQLADEFDLLTEKFESTSRAVEKNQSKISALKKQNIEYSQKIALLKEEKEDLLKRAENRQAYLLKLKARQQRIDSERQTHAAAAMLPESMDKPTRTLSQRIVISEAVNVASEAFSQIATSRDQQVQQIRKSPEEISIETFIEEKLNKPLRTNSEHLQSAKHQQSAQNSYSRRKLDGSEQKTHEETKINDSISSCRQLDPAILPQLNTNKLSNFSQRRQDIFQKKTPQIAKDYDQMQSQSLDGTALEQRKKQIVRAAILRNQIQQQTWQEVESDVAPRKCTCLIY